MSNHISFVCVWINFMPLLSSVLRNCIYSPFELTGLGGWGVLGMGDVKSMCINIVCPSSCKTEESTKGSMQKYNHNTVFNFIPM
jgi:hypothetical protein